MIDLTFDKQWTRKHIRDHAKQLAKCKRMEAALAAKVQEMQAAIDAERELEDQLGRSRDAAEHNFERRWGENAWRQLVKNEAKRR